MPLASLVYSRKGSFSQYGQESFVLDIVHRGARGFYVDVGASDGKTNSNTFLLEQMGWQGLCIEPNPESFARLQQTRTGAHCCNVAASDRVSEDADFLQVESGPVGRSGLLDTYRPEDLERMQRRQNSRIAVPTRTLEQLFRECHVPRGVDYLDIDVEGHELHVLRGIDFRRHSFEVIGVETRPGFADHANIISFLTKQGYHPVALLGADTMFMRRP